MNIIALNRSQSFVKATVPYNLFIVRKDGQNASFQNTTLFQTLSSSNQEKVTIQNSPMLLAQIFRDTNKI
jgi:hypothetical protein